MKNKIKLIAGVLGVVAALSPNFALATEKQEIWGFNEVKTIQKGESIDFSNYYFKYGSGSFTSKEDIKEVSLVKYRKDKEGFDHMVSEAPINNLENLEKGDYLIRLRSERYTIGDEEYPNRELWTTKIESGEFEASSCVGVPRTSPEEVQRYFEMGLDMPEGSNCVYIKKDSGEKVAVRFVASAIFRKVKVVDQSGEKDVSSVNSGNESIDSSSPQALQFTAPNTGFSGGISAFALSTFSFLGLATFFARKK